MFHIFRLTQLLKSLDMQEERVELAWRPQEHWLFGKLMSSLLQGTWNLQMQQNSLFLKTTKLRVWMS